MTPDDDRDRSHGLIRAVLALLQEMDERGERTGPGTRDLGPGSSIDYSVHVGELAGPLGDDPVESQRSRTDDPTPGAHTTTRETSAGLVVAADLPGVEARTLDTRIDRDAGVLLIEVSGEEAARFPLDDEGWTVEGSHFSNGVLEVELRRS